jgi:histidinol-phosphatase (PHP family)
MPWSNYHSHTNFSDGSNNPDEYIKEAIRQAVHVYGFSCHAPVPFETDWCMKIEKLEDYYAEIKKLKSKYASQISILLGLEVDYVPKLVGPKDVFFKNGSLNYLIGSVHFVDSFQDGTPWGIDASKEVFIKGLEQIWKNDIKKAIHRYYQLIRDMIKRSTPDIIGHFDKIRMHNEGNKYFSEDESWYKDEVFKSLEVIRASKCLVEVNTRGIYKGYTKEPYPSLWILNEAKRMGIPIVLNSDAHRPVEITGMFAETAKMLAKEGYTELYNWMNGSWRPFPFNESGIII